MADQNGGDGGGDGGKHRVIGDLVVEEAAGGEGGGERGGDGSGGRRIFPCIFIFFELARLICVMMFEYLLYVLSCVLSLNLWI